MLCKSAKSPCRLQADAVSAGVVIANAPEGNIVLANPEAKRVFRNGIRPGQVIADYGQWAAANIDGQPLKPEEYPLAPPFFAVRPRTPWRFSATGRMERQPELLYPPGPSMGRMAAELALS